jgi:EutQ-like cupin domain
MALSIMQKANLDAVTPDVHGLISKQSVMLDTVTVTKVTFHPGAKWSQDLKDYAGTDSCLLPHVAYILQGVIEVVMDDGSREIFSKGDIMMVPPGHDAWAVGDEPCVFLQFSQGDNYYGELTAL